ncbi:MAG: HAMP domain-containing histidine kinase [Alphaproteobacteria bacterium]|nr:HAMP domain-containing histidine kinase [Alphaproteobacteria bacterium]
MARLPFLTRSGRTEPPSLAGRLIFGAVLWCIGALVLGALLLAFLFRSTLVQGFDARLATLMDNLVAAIALAGPESGAPALPGAALGREFDRAYSGAYWQIRPWPVPLPGAAEESDRRSRSLWTSSLPVPAAVSGEGGVTTAPGPLDQRLRVFSRLITLPGSAQPSLVQIALDASPLAADITRFQGGLAAAVLILAVLLVSGVWFQVRHGLRPVHALAEAVGAVRRGEAGRVMAPAPAELAPLVAELNRLLDHNEAVLERARTQVGNLAHGLKTPLAVIQNEVRPGHPPAPDLVRAQTEVMETYIRRYLALARAAAERAGARATTPVLPAVEALTRTLAKLHAERPLALATDLPADLCFAGEAQDLEEMLGNLLDNAFKWARGTITVHGRIEGRELVLTMRDDGPGIPPGSTTGLARRGARLDESVPGTGLGLAIVKDIAAAYEGSLRLSPGSPEGLEAELRLPALLPAGTGAGGPSGALRL